MKNLLPLLSKHRVGNAETRSIREPRNAFHRRLIMCGLLFISHSLAASNCPDPEFRQFDFWLGHWQIHTPSGQLAGHNRISMEHDGCVIHERYEAPGGYSGESLNIYDPVRERWHQTWVDNSGTLLVLEGQASSGGMTLTGETLSDNGETIEHRISWQRQPDDSVRQHWQTRSGEEDWTTVFDGRYTRVQNQTNSTTLPRWRRR